MNHIKISTMTLTTKITDAQHIDLYTVFDNININTHINTDDKLIGVKYFFKETLLIKGSIKSSKSFSNQLSIVYDHCYIKIFQNGTLHITGCKSIEEGHIVRDAILNIVKKCLNSEYTTKTVIGFVHNKLYNINGIYYRKTLIENRYLYITENKKGVTSKDNSRGVILDENFNNIGFFKKDRKYNNKSYKYIITTLKCVNIDVFNINDILYKTTTEIIQFTNLECITVCSINASIDIHKQIDLDLFYNESKEKINDHIIIYDKNRYHGLKILYNICNDTIGIKCKCKQCYTVTLIVFRTGKINITGVKSLNILNNLYNSKINFLFA